MIKYGAQVNSKKSQKLLGMKVCHGFADVSENGKFLYRAYVSITRLKPEDSIFDAKIKMSGTEDFEAIIKKREVA